MRFFKKNPVENTLTLLDEYEINISSRNT